MISHWEIYCADSGGLALGIEPQGLKFYASGENGAWRYKYEDGRIIWKGLHNILVEILSQVGDKNVETTSLGKEADSWVITFTTESGKRKCFDNNIPTELEDIITNETRHYGLFKVIQGTLVCSQAFYAGHCFEPLGSNALLGSLQ